MNFKTCYEIYTSLFINVLYSGFPEFGVFLHVWIHLSNVNLTKIVFSLTISQVLGWRKNIYFIRSMYTTFTEILLGDIGPVHVHFSDLRYFFKKMFSYPSENCKFSKIQTRAVLNHTPL